MVNTLEKVFKPAFVIHVITMHSWYTARSAFCMDNRTANYPLFRPKIFPLLRVTDVKALFFFSPPSKFHSYLLQTFSNQVPQLFETMSTFARGTPVNVVSTESL